jgi:G3E family GTPase
MNQPLSVTVVAGSAGTNGATFLNDMLTDIKGQRVTAIIPARGGQKPRTKDGVAMVPTTERLKRLGQGCSCCTVRSDLMIKIKRIAAEQSADHIVVHLAPRSDLDTLGKTFTVADSDGFRLSDIARLESVITVIDASSVLSTLESNSSGALIERIESASMLAFENTGAMTPQHFAQLVSTLKGINPDARIVGEEQSDTPQFSPAPLQCNLPS